MFVSSPRIRKIYVISKLRKEMPENFSFIPTAISVFLIPINLSNIHFESSFSPIFHHLE